MLRNAAAFSICSDHIYTQLDRLSALPPPLIKRTYNKSARPHLPFGNIRAQRASGLRAYICTWIKLQSARLPCLERYWFYLGGSSFSVCTIVVCASYTYCIDVLHNIRLCGINSRRKGFCRILLSIYMTLPNSHIYKYIYMCVLYMQREDK